MIYVTGDIHADQDRFKTKAMRRLKKNDTLIVSGDFGFVWDGSAKERKMLEWLGKRPYNILFIEGTHDNLDLLAQYPEVDYCGGKARQIAGKLHYLMRGEIYSIESDHIFVFGGGESRDMDTRVTGETWWQNELPTMDEIASARANLVRFGNVVDYIVTHEASSIVNSFMDMNETRTNQLAAFFDEVSKTVRFKHWFFGSYHLDKVIPPLYHAVYQEVLPLKAIR